MTSLQSRRRKDRKPAESSRPLLGPGWRGRAAEALRNELKRPSLHSLLAAIVEFSNDAIFSRTLDGTVTTWNAAAERIFGYKAEEIINHSSRLLVPSRHRDEFQKLLSRIRRGRTVQSFETERVRKNGERLHLSLTLSPIRNASDQLVGCSTIARDITEQRRVREALARSERELADLFAEASVGLVLVSREGTVLRANRAFCELVKCRPEQVVGQALKAFHPEGAVVGELLSRLASRQTLHNVQIELRTSKGRTKFVLVDVNALWEAGRLVYSRWFVRDISRRKQLETELLEISERERRGFAQELHDGLGQQLGGIAYLANVLRQRLEERRAPEAAEAAHIYALMRSAIEQTRRVARSLSPIPEGPEGLMTALGELAAQTSELFGVRCRFACPKPVLVGDSAVAAHLYRISQEAVNNAIKHARPRAVTIRLRSDRDRVTVAVADDGQGIDPLSPKREGLGLSIMNYRAGLVRGTVVVRPRPARGTEVVCTAPCAEVELTKSGQ
ncbi:MAG: PAS domain S-box protein [Verrucomicrobia bacterium]|nr:PAS domain S-box protein [Verrucomicrobiota bacterium]